MLKDLFRGRPRYATINPTPSDGRDRPAPTAPREAPDGLWLKCEGCETILYRKELQQHFQICPKCGYHFRIGGWERLEQLADEGSFTVWEDHLTSVDPLGFPGYAEKVTKAQARTGLSEAVIVGRAAIEELPVALGIFDFNFVGGSMGSVVGERLTRLFERAEEERLPVVIVSAGGGGARMQEGILSLMQMAKTSQAVARYRRCRMPYISVLTDPTMGGVYASFASLGDVIIAEPGARIGFAGPRIVEETTRQKLPEGFQTAEYALQNGMIDMVVPRPKLREQVAQLIRLHL